MRRGARRMLVTRIPAILVAVSTFGLLTVAGPPTAASADQGFTFNWTAKPSSPQPWRPGLLNDWDLVTHDSDVMTGRPFPPATGQHGADCAPFPATHVVNAIDDAAFLCNNHMMTVTATGGYAETVLTPAQLADWSDGTVRILFSVSTLRTTTRDWLTIDVTPFAENLITPADTHVDLEGQARDHVDCNMTSSPPSIWSCYVRSGFERRDLPSAGAPSVEEVLAARRQSASAITRTRYELDVSKTHVRFGLPDYGTWFVDADATVPFSRGVVQLQHHAYDSGKQCHAGSPFQYVDCVNNTWHWSDFSLSNAVPFTMIRPVGLGSGPVGGGSSTPTITLAAPAPSESFLRFAGSGDFIWFSTDGGTSWVRAAEQAASNLNQSANKSYFMPIPAGTTSVLFMGKDWAGGPWLVQDPAVWSLQRLDTAPSTPSVGQAKQQPSSAPGVARVAPPAAQSQSTPFWRRLVAQVLDLGLHRGVAVVAAGTGLALVLLGGGWMGFRLNRRGRRRSRSA